MTTSTPAASPLRQRMIDDMRMRKMEPKTQSACAAASEVAGRAQPRGGCQADCGSTEPSSGHARQDDTRQPAAPRVLSARLCSK